MIEKYLINFDDISNEIKIGEAQNSATYKSELPTYQFKCAVKIMNDENNENEAKFIEYIKKVINANYLGIIPFIGFCSSSKNLMSQNIIITKFATSNSLQYIFNKIDNGEDLSWFDSVRKFIIIYGVAHSINYLHSLNIIHGKLTPSNILLDENKEPQISDFQHSLLCQKFDYSISNIVKNKLFYYIDPCTLKNNCKINAKSDVYSFAIIVIQILSGSTHIYEKEDDLQNLIKEIKNGLMPMIPNNYPVNLRNLLITCLNKDQELRPTFKQICQKLDIIINSLPDISTVVFNEYKEKIIGNINIDELSKEVAQMKKEADKGDPEMMYMYANQRLNGTNCKKNITEATRYFMLAKQKGNQAAIQKLAILRNNGGLITNTLESDSESQDLPHNIDDNLNANIHDDNNIDNNDSLKNSFISLIDNPIFDQTEYNIDDLLENLDNEIMKKNKFVFDENLVENQNFIFTEGSKERLQKLYNYIKVGIPVLLEGPTGTAKTLSSEIVCKLLNQDLIRFNLSSETKTQDLIGRYVGDESSWAGISQQDGPFSQAFQEGKVLLLDEINLAPASVLQCIEEALDSGILSIEIPGRPLKSIKMHKNFRVIATQNPNKGSYANKRQSLGLKFYSRFQVINFPAFTIKELLSIGKGLAEKFNYKDMHVIQDLVNFHKEWSENPQIANDSQCFTIREIAATIKALSQKKSIFDTVMTIYGARYQKGLKCELQKVLQKYPNLTKDPKEFVFPDFSGCYINESLISTVKSALLSLSIGRNIIITGKEGCGKTQVALWISEYYNKNIDFDDNNSNQSFFCVCTEEIKVSDLIGHQAPSSKSDGTSELIKWKDGFLTKAIKLGKCSVLECLDEAPSTVTERLNGLLDQKYDNQVKYFDIPENSATPSVPIRDTFRILGTANIDRISQMSPAFLNRFDIIVLENQISEKFSKNQYIDLLKTILNKHCTDLSYKENNIESQPELGEDEQFSDDSDFEFVGTDSDDNNDPDDLEKDINHDNTKANEITYSDNIVQMIYEKIKNEKNISRISKLCNAIIKLLSTFKNNKKITENDVVNFAFLLLQNNKQFNVEKEIEIELLNSFKQIKDSSDDPFFYKKSPTLCTFLAKLAAYSIIEQPVCITGPTGVGKTSAARAFARMRPRRSNYKTGFLMHSFHSRTKVSHFFGSTTLLDGKIVFHDGTLTKSLKLGLVFIADEFNLSTQSVMKSLSLALDPTIGKNVFIPGIGQIINISPEFHFIACQNELGTLGRNAIPDSIAQRFVYIDYPKPETKDIQNICISISQENFGEDQRFKEDDEDLAREIAKYMIMLNDKKIVYIPQWSLRDITKLFRRIYPQNCYMKFVNITPLHHVLFYTMSTVSPNDVKYVIKNVGELMKRSFHLNDEETNTYINCYNATPEIKEYKNHGLCLMKGDIGISIDQNKKLMIDNKLPSLWDAIFKIYLSDEREPILLMGNSGFKTFLASHFLPKAQIITLNQETNVAQLLGSSAFMTNSEAKLFYIDYIYKWENGNLQRNDIINIIKKAQKGSVPLSFNYALDHFTEKLFDNQEKIEKSVLSNTTLEFRPGLFLNSILQGQSLILKDLSNLPTIVLERFNELFSGKQSITLSEDIHNTFTSAENKELTNFNRINDSFRVFATCPANSPSKLSDAVLSRFTVICLPEYSSDQQKIVLKSYIKSNKLRFIPSDIDILTQFQSSYLKQSSIHFTFPQMIKVIEITSKLNNQTSSDNQKLNIGKALYRVLGGLLESSKKKDVLFEQIKLFFDIPEIYHNQINECPLVIKNNDDCSGVFSNISNLFLKVPSPHECKMNVAFTKTFNDLLDILHMALTIHNPLILEGVPGQGKHTAIHYISKMLNIETVHITISQSTKVEDLFGKDTIIRQQDGIHVEMVETQFLKIIKSTDDLDNKYLIILENINNSSPALLNALVPVFDSHSTSILLPNGSTIEKGKFDIIGIFNTQQMSSSKEKLPSSLINSSIYHIVSKPKKSEILHIVLTKFTHSNISNEEANRFHTNYIHARNIVSKDGSSPEVFTLNDIDKYLLFRKLTKEFFDELTISQMIFGYKFSSDEMMQKILNELKLENMKFNPIFNYDIPPKNLNIRISESITKGLNVPLYNKINTLKISKINSLTLPQKHCLIFLACSVLAKRSCVVQGDTASGKSHLIRLFAELTGAKLNVFQMNNDSNISILAGQSVLNDKLSPNDIKDIKKAFADLSIDENIKQQLNNELKINFDDDNSFNPRSLKKLLEYIKSIELIIKDKKYFSEIEAAVNVIKEIMNPVNRFEHKESAFIHAIRNGEWVLIDGIESAPSVIAEKISSLCSNNPELNLFEYGPDFFFSRNKNSLPKNRIHDNFHLFITFNPKSMKETQIIDQTFLVKSVTFTLPSMDNTIENSAQILYGSLSNLGYDSELSKQLAARYASMHHYAKSKSQKNTEDFAGDIQFNGRTLNFAIKIFEGNKISNDSLQSELAKILSLSIKSLYWNSYINAQKTNSFKSNCLRVFKHNPTDELLFHFQTGDMIPEMRNKKILILLRNIQKCVLNSQVDSSYSLPYFLDLCSLIRISDLKYVQFHINDTLRKIKLHSNLNDPHKNPLIVYGILESINSLFKIIITPKIPIKQEHTFLSLKEDVLRNNKSISNSLFKIDLLIQLLNEKLFSEKSSILLNNEMYSKIINQMAIIVSNHDKKLIAEIFKEIKSDINLIDFIDLAFPYLALKESQLLRISYWLPLAKILIKNEISFSYTIDNIEFNFNELSTTDFCIDLIMNEKDNLSLSQNSTIHYHKRHKELKIKKNDEKNCEKNDLIYYCLIKELSANPDQSIDEKTLKAQFSHSRKMFSEGSIENPSVNSMMSVRDLFITKQKQISIICFIWNLVFTLTKKEIKNLAKIINPIESALLLSAEKMYINIDKYLIKGIIDWSNWASGLENSIPLLYKTVLQSEQIQNISLPKINDRINAIQNEIRYLKKAPENMKIFWNSDDLINICQNELIQLSKLTSNNPPTENEWIIKEKIEKLKKNLVNAKVPQKFNDMKIELVNKINLINEFTESKYNFIQKIVNQFYADTHSENQDDNNGFIIWPQIKTENYNVKYFKTENIKLFEALIWYSQILSILKEINLENDLLKNLWKLNDFDEMECPREILFKKLIDNTNENHSGFTLADKDQALFTLNANMICKLININKSFIQDPQKICKIFNDYMNRSSCDEIELQWIYQTSSALSNDFSLQIPKFKPNDLIFLIVNKKSDTEYRNGPFFSGVQNTLFLKDVGNLMHQKFSSFHEAAKAIAEIVYRSIISNNDDPPQDFEKLKNAINNQNRLTETKYQIVNKIKDIFKIAEWLESWHDHKLLFDDISFLDGHWENNKKLMCQFPSLIFWICKNQQVARTLENRYKHFNPEKNRMPIWLLTLRIMSSRDCIKFDTKYEGIVSTIINEETTNLVNRYLNNCNTDVESINFDWINIMISNIPPQIVKTCISLIHNFFISLSEDQQIHQSKVINRMKIKYVKEAISIIIKQILSNNSKQLITDDLYSTNSISQFLAFPSKYIQKKIDNSIFEEMSSLTKSNTIKQLKCNLKSLNYFQDMIKNLQDTILEEENEAKLIIKKKN